jgi:hypothetical protein
MYVITILFLEIKSCKYNITLFLYLLTKLKKFKKSIVRILFYKRLSKLLKNIFIKFTFFTSIFKVKCLFKKNWSANQN